VLLLNPVETCCSGLLFFYRAAWKMNSSVEWYW